MSTSVEQSSTAPAAFARKASGLVRSFSQTDALFYNIIAINVFLLSALSFTTMVVAFPGASAWLAVLIAGVICLFEAIVYAFLTTIMPRSGGDYVFQSRVLGGSVGTFFTFSGIVLAQIASIILVAAIGTGIIFGPSLTILGAYWDSSALTDIGEWLGTEAGIFVFGLVCAAWITFINLKGLRLYAAVQRLVFFVAAGGLALILIVMLFSSHQDFVNSLNSFMSEHYGVNNAYQTVLDSSTASTDFSFGATISATVLAALAFIFPAWGVMQAGEIKRAGAVKGNLYAIVGAEVISILIALVAVLLLVSRVGDDFFIASGDLAFNAPEEYPLPVAPFFGFFAALMHVSPALALLVFVTAVAWFLMLIPNIMVATTRVLLALSFDRMLPDWMGQVGKRSHAPINAIFVTAAGFLFFLVLNLFVSDLITFMASLIMMSVTTFAVTMVAGGLMPWLRRDLFERAPDAIQTRIAGVPLITICAAIFFAFAVYVDYSCLTKDELAVNTTKGLAFVGGIYLVSALVYLTAFVYRRRQKVDLGLINRELPVE